jgi:hypothetical protein
VLPSDSFCCVRGSLALARLVSPGAACFLDNETVRAYAVDTTHRYETAIGTFTHPRYEIIPTDRVFDGLEEVREYFRESRTSVKLELDRPQLRNGGVPNDRSFAFPTEQNAGVSKVIQVDEHVQGPR